MTNRNHWAIKTGTFWLAVLVLLVSGFVAFRLHTKELRCLPEQHIFGGKPYAIEVCHVGGGELHSNMRLRVYSEGGSLLAQRQFTFLDVPGNLNHLLYKDAEIAFTDDDSDHSTLVTPKEHVLQMPPTWSDWLSANVARVLWP